MKDAVSVYILPAELCVGQYIHLDLSWLDHPFPKASFKIKDQDQIDKIRALGLARIRCAQELSDAGSLPVQPSASASASASASSAPGGEGVLSPAAAPASAAAGASPASSMSAASADPALPVADQPARASAADPRAQAAAKQASRQAQQKQRERELAAAAKAYKSLTRNVYAQPAEARAQAGELVEGLADSLAGAADLTLHLMSEHVGGESVYHHSLNVSLLAMLLATSLKAPEPVVKLIGLGGLLHDIGKIDIPEQVWRKSTPLTRAEQAWVQQHAEGSAKIAVKMGLPAEVQTVLAQHHELADGSGYPKGLRGAEISFLAKIIAVANTYDNLCNPPNADLAVTPHEAVAMMFGIRKAKFDEKVLATFVRCMGVYPPGTLVALSNGTVAKVVAVNATLPLKPTVQCVDPRAPDGHSTLDLEDHPTLTVQKTLKASELTPAARAILMPHMRVTFFVDASKDKSDRLAVYG